MVEIKEVENKDIDLHMLHYDKLVNLVKDNKIVVIIILTVILVLIVSVSYYLNYFQQLQENKDIPEEKKEELPINKKELKEDILDDILQNIKNNHLNLSNKKEIMNDNAFEKITDSELKLFQSKSYQNIEKYDHEILNNKETILNKDINKQKENIETVLVDNNDDKIFSLNNNNITTIHVNNNTSSVIKTEHLINKLRKLKRI